MSFTPKRAKSNITVLNYLLMIFLYRLITQKKKLIKDYDLLEEEFFQFFRIDKIKGYVPLDGVNLPELVRSKPFLWYQKPNKHIPKPSNKSSELQKDDSDVKKKDINGNLYNKKDLNKYARSKSNSNSSKPQSSNQKEKGKLLNKSQNSTKFKGRTLKQKEMQKKYLDPGKLCMPLVEDDIDQTRDKLRSISKEYRHTSPRLNQKQKNKNFLVSFTLPEKSKISPESISTTETITRNDDIEQHDVSKVSPNNKESKDRSDSAGKIRSILKAKLMNRNK